MQYYDRGQEISQGCRKSQIKPCRSWTETDTDASKALCPVSLTKNIYILSMKNFTAKK